MSAESTGSVPGLLLLDTHVLVWSAFKDPRLGRKAAAAINRAARADRIQISAITPWEIGLLATKKRINLHVDTLVWIREALSKPGIRLAPLEPEIAVESTRLPFEIHADPADRILVATARSLRAVLVTADRALLDLAAQGNFKAMSATS